MDLQQLADNGDVSSFDFSIITHPPFIVVSSTYVYKQLKPKRVHTLPATIAVCDCIDDDYEITCWLLYHMARNDISDDVLHYALTLVQDEDIRTYFDSLVVVDLYILLTEKALHKSLSKLLEFDIEQITKIHKVFEQLKDLEMYKSFHDHYHGYSQI